MVKICFTFLVCATLCVLRLSAQPADSIKVHTDFAYQNGDQHLCQQVYCQSDISVHAVIQLACYKYDNGADSILVLKKNQKAILKKGITTIKLDYSKKKDSSYYLPKFYSIFKKTGAAPPGIYKTYLIIKGAQDTLVNKMFLRNVDSSLSINSVVRSRVNKNLLAGHHSFLGFGGAGKINGGGATAGDVIGKSKSRLGRSLKMIGLTPVTCRRNGKTYIDLYYQDWFAGRYEAKTDEPLTGQVMALQDKATVNPGSFTTNGLDDYSSIFSQFRAIKGAKKDNDELTGEVSLRNNIASGQEAYSGVDNNYYELTDHLGDVLATVSDRRMSSGYSDKSPAFATRYL